MHAPIGLRIRTRRKALSVSQAALAHAVGVSPSYLNLIEANKRQVGGSLLQRIALELNMELSELTGDTEHRLLHELVEAFADPVLSESNMDSEQIRLLVSINPEVAKVVATLHRAYAVAMASAEAYANRLRADPILSQLLHQVLSSITAIRSGAEILEAVPDLSLDDQKRFLETINREARSLTAVARNLIGQFDQTSSSGRFASARREVDDMIFQAQNHFSELEEAAAILRSRMALEGQLGEATMVACLGREHAITVQRTTESRGAHAFGYDAPKRTLWFRNTVPRSTRQFQMVRLIAELSFSDMLDETPQVSSLVSPLARRGAKRYLAAYIAGAVLFPYEQFLADAQALRYDVDALSERYDASFEQIAHRLVTLRRAGAAGVPFGFLRADPAGRLSKHFPLPGLLLPNSGHACPLWAIYAAFRSPGHVVRQITRFPDGSRFLFVAKAAPKRSSGFTDHAMPHSVLLITNVLYADDTVYGDGLNLSDARFDVPVGPTCRLCTRSDCGSRQEEPWSPGGEEPPATLV